MMISKQIWNIEATSNYLKRVYGREVIPNGNPIEAPRRKHIFAQEPGLNDNQDQGNYIQATLFNSVDLEIHSFTVQSVRNMMHRTFSQLKQENASVVLDFESLSVINQYCSKMYKLVPQESSDNTDDI